MKFEEINAECAQQSRRSAMWDAQKECLLFHSLFGLVLENTHEEQYVTEKLWQVLKAGAVPIVAGDPNLYRRHLPSPEAAIFLEDFPSIKAAASYLQTLMHNRTKWIRHVNWKAGDFSDDFMDLVHHSFATLACDLCDKYGNELLPSKVPLPAVHLTHCMSHYFLAMESQSNYQESIQSTDSMQFL